MPNAFVRKLTGYGSLTNDEVLLLVEASHAKSEVAAHRDLIREGDNPGPAFVILEGWAIRYKVLPDGSRQIVSFMMPGDFCDPHMGTLEVMDHSVGTITMCRIASIPRESMEALILSTPALTRSFWRARLIDEGVSRAWIASMGRRDATGRVAHLMLELFVRMRDIGLTTDGSCRLPLTQPVIADALGLTGVHTNRVFRALREQGLMTLNSGTLTMLDVVALAKKAGFNGNYLHRSIGIVV